MNRSVTKEMRDMATDISKWRIKKEYDRYGFDYNVRVDRIIVGLIGELVFKAALEEADIQFETSFGTVGYDKYDFKINNKIYDIKASDCNGTYKYLNLLYSEDQYQSGLINNYDYVVQVFIDGKERGGKFNIKNCKNAVIVGYVNFCDLPKYRQEPKHYGDNYCVKLSELNKFELI